MLLFFSKLLPALIFPAGLALILSVVAAWLAFRKGARAAGSVATSTALLLYLASSPIVSNLLLVGLERQNPPTRDLPDAAAIVLLGGGMTPMFAPRLDPETNAAGDRVIHAARLWKRGLAPLVVPTGGYIGFLTKASGTEADLYERLLIDVFGLPENAVIPMGRSRTTYEDAEFTARLFEDGGIPKEILLVTSASHMVRAAALFRQAGFVVYPAPTDFHADDPYAFKAFDLLPNGVSISETSIALHEYLGLLAYKLLGRI